VEWHIKLNSAAGLKRYEVGSPFLVFQMDSFRCQDESVWLQKWGSNNLLSVLTSVSSILRSNEQPHWIVAYTWKPYLRKSTDTLQWKCQYCFSKSLRISEYSSIKVPLKCLGTEDKTGYIKQLHRFFKIANSISFRLHHHHWQHKTAHSHPQGVT